MERQIRVVGVGGSLGIPSRSLAALKIALSGAEAAGAMTKLFDIRSLDVPLYDPAVEPPMRIRDLADEVQCAHGLLWSSPLYHGTLSGSFKNVLDWLQILSDRDPPYLTNKIIGLISVAGGVQGLQAVNTMEFVVRAMRGWAVPMVMPIARAWQVFDEAGRPKDPATEQQLHALGAEVVRAARQFGVSGSCDYDDIGVVAGWTAQS
jgi:FMN reductase